ncbi:MAG: ribose 5-phosphate isomerase B [Desulfomonile tiedjei]|nr:ribose 5-phosphate isomerase B [Desulfomonile tiedjei]
MKIAFGSDHAGFALKEELLDFLKDSGHILIDLGTFSTAPVDYPDFAAAVGRAVQTGEVDRGVIVCGSGVGACIAANKLHGVRGGICHDTYSAHQGVEHDDMNVLCLGARIIGIELAREIVRTFLAAVFTAEERHVRRLSKVIRLDETGGL